MAESERGDVSERYEFDAPSQVVDLKELENAESDDKWFGESPLYICSWLIFLIMYNVSSDNNSRMLSLSAPPHPFCHM